MSNFIFTTLMVTVIGSITLGLAGCVTDGSYESSHRNDGSNESWQERAHKSKGGSRYQSPTERSADDILSSGCCG